MFAILSGKALYVARLLPREGCRAWTASWTQATQNQLKQGCQQRLNDLLQPRVAVNDKGYEYTNNGMAQGKWYAKCCHGDTKDYKELQAQGAKLALPLSRRVPNVRLFTCWLKDTECTALVGFRCMGEL